MVRFEGVAAHPNRGIPRNFFTRSSVQSDVQFIIQIHTSFNTYLRSLFIENRAMRQRSLTNTMDGERSNKIKIGKPFKGGNRCPFFKMTRTKHVLHFFLSSKLQIVSVVNKT